MYTNKNIQSNRHNTHTHIVLTHHTHRSQSHKSDTFITHSLNAMRFYLFLIWFGFWGFGVLNFESKLIIITLQFRSSFFSSFICVVVVDFRFELLVELYIECIYNTLLYAYILGYYCVDRDIHIISIGIWLKTAATTTTTITTTTHINILHIHNTRNGARARTRTYITHNSTFYFDGTSNTLFFSLSFQI